MLLGAYCETSEAGARAAAPDGTLWNWASLRRDVLDPGGFTVLCRRGMSAARAS